MKDQRLRLIHVASGRQRPCPQDDQAKRMLPWISLALLAVTPLIVFVLVPEWVRTGVLVPSPGRTLWSYQRDGLVMLLGGGQGNLALLWWSFQKPREKAALAQAALRALFAWFGIMATSTTLGWWRAPWSDRDAGYSVGLLFLAACACAVYFTARLLVRLFHRGGAASSRARWREAAELGLTGVSTGLIAAWCSEARFQGGLFLAYAAAASVVAQLAATTMLQHRELPTQA